MYSFVYLYLLDDSLNEMGFVYRCLCNEIQDRTTCAGWLLEIPELVQMKVGTQGIQTKHPVVISLIAIIYMI